MPAIVAKHPDHCAACRDARVTTERELRETQDAVDQLAAVAASTDLSVPAREFVAELVQLWNGTHNPIPRAVALRLLDVLNAPGGTHVQR